MSVKSSRNFAQGLEFWLVVLSHGVNLRHGTHGFTSLPKEVLLRIFTLWKNPSTPAGFELATLGSNGEYDNHGTTDVESSFDPWLSIDNDIQPSLDDYLTFFRDYVLDNHIQPSLADFPLAGRYPQYLSRNLFLRSKRTPSARAPCPFPVPDYLDGPASHVPPVNNEDIFAFPCYMVNHLAPIRNYINLRSSLRSHLYPQF